MNSPEPFEPESEELWRTILSRLDEGVLLLDAEGAIRLANDACLRLFDVDNLILGQPLLAALKEPALDEFARAILRDGVAEEREFTIRRRGAARLLSVRGEKTNSNGALLIFTDVTATRALEDVASDFVANVSHELRTPISILAGYIENLADFPKMPRPEQLEIFEIMQEHATRLKSLLDDLLTLACFESRSEVLDYTDLDLRQFLLRLKKDWHAALSSKDMLFVIEVADDAGVIRVDRFRFEQVMHNLIDNAFKYTPIEGQIRVRALNVGDHIEISVEDNGAGIPQEDLPHIFDRFYRVDKARSRKYGGTGLGLSIVKHIITLHGGTVRAESTLQMSTRIIISLPRHQPELP
jgi:two-component system phosphate regulon sensor histidine kinase PhoR